MFGIGKGSAAKSGKLTISSASLEEQIHNVHASLNRCLANDDFINVFYDVFMGTDDEIRGKFAHTDFEQQKKLLRKALLSAVTFAAGGAVAHERLEAIRASHNRTNLDIKPEFYPIWVDSLIKAIATCDPQYTPTLEADWRAVMKPTVEFLASGYLEY